MKLTNDVLKRLNNFFDYYRDKSRFINNLEKKHKAPDEIILLVCCYLDQLGSCLYSKEGSNKGSFIKLLFEHSGERDELNLISVGNLASDLFRFADFANFLIERPGRIKVFSDEEKLIIKFIDQTEISLTSSAIYKFLIAIYENLKRNFRIHSYQTDKKNSFGNLDTILESIVTDKKIKKFAPNLSENILRNLIKEYSFASILYRNYRCKAVHEIAGISIHSAKFWKKKRPYFIEIRFPFYRHSFFALEFPSFFLIEVLNTCIDCVEKAIIGKGLLPFSIFNAICDINEFDFLDIETMEEEKPIKLKIE